MLKPEKQAKFMKWKLTVRNYGFDVSSLSTLVPFLRLIFERLLRQFTKKIRTLISQSILSRIGRFL